MTKNIKILVLAMAYFLPPMAAGLIINGIFNSNFNWMEGIAAMLILSIIAIVVSTAVIYALYYAKGHFLNRRLLKYLSDNPLVSIYGEAQSHCFQSTIRQITKFTNYRTPRSVEGLKKVEPVMKIDKKDLPLFKGILH